MAVVVILVPVQCRMARVALGWGVRDLARAASLSADTVARFERGKKLKPSTVAGLRRAFEVAGLEFIAADSLGGVGVRLSRPEANSLKSDLPKSFSG